MATAPLFQNCHLPNEHCKSHGGTHLPHLLRQTIWELGLWKAKRMWHVVRYLRENNSDESTKDRTAVQL